MKEKVLSTDTINGIAKVIEILAKNMQVVDISSVSNILVSFIESPAYQNILRDKEKILATNEKFVDELSDGSLLTNEEIIKLSENKLLTLLDKLLVPDFCGILETVKSVATLVDYAYKLAEEYSTDKKDNILENDFSSQQEFEEAFTQQIENPIGFQEKFANWTEEKKKKYFVIVMTIVFLWTNFIQPYFQEKIGVPVTAFVVSNVRELPDYASEVICQLQDGIEAIIVENTNYYYKVRFVDENGIEREGYVAKRNLKLLEEEINSEE